MGYNNGEMQCIETARRWRCTRARIVQEGVQSKLEMILRPDHLPLLLVASWLP